MPNTTKANLHQNGEILELILDDDNFFSNAQGNSVFGDIKMKGIDIDAYYSLNPIDTLRISVQTNNAIAGMYPNYKKSTIVRGDIIGKLNDTTYTYYRYRKGEIYINDGLDYAVKSSFRFDTSITYKPLDSFKLDPNLRFSKIATIPYFDPSIKGGTVVIVIDKKYEPPKLCEQSQLDVAIHYDGSFLDNREFQAEMANIPNMIEYIELIDDRGNKWQPYFADSTSPAAVKTSSDRLIIPNGIDKTKNARARYRVSINNPDYEI